MPDFGPVPNNIETPCVLVDRTRLEANIARVADIGARHGVAVRPHVKTHKSLAIARMQLVAGAVGVTASQVYEALDFVRGGVASVTCAYPCVQALGLDLLLAEAGERGCDVRFVADSAAGLDALAAAGQRHGLALPVYVKVDVGLHRCGVAPDSPALVRLARDVAGAAHLSLAGILSHAGHAYAARDEEGARTVARAEAGLMRTAKGHIEAAGVVVPEVSVGSTPTVLASDDFEGITEIRPGNYVFMDRTPVRLGLAAEDDVSLTVLATVVSINDSWIIVDAGSKILSSDGGAHGALGEDFGLAYPVMGDGSLSRPLPVGRLSEEHGWLVRNGTDLAVGTRVRILPNHSCPVANLARARHRKGALVFV